MPQVMAEAAGGVVAVQWYRGVRQGCRGGDEPARGQPCGQEGCRVAAGGSCRSLVHGSLHGAQASGAGASVAL